MHLRAKMAPSSLERLAQRLSNAWIRALQSKQTLSAEARRCEPVVPRPPRPLPTCNVSKGHGRGAVVGDRSDDRVTITITGNSLHFHRDTNFWFKTTFTLPAGTDPQELHATIKDCPPPRDSIGKVVVAIFKVEGGKLTLAAMGERTEEMPKSFEAADDEGWTRYELRKVQPQKEKTEPPRTR